MKSMTLRDEVAQLIFIPFHGTAPHSRSREYRKFMSPCDSGESWLAVVITLSLPPVKTSQPQPDPNCLAVVSLKVFLKASKSPKSVDICLAIAPEGLPPMPAELAGPISFQKAVWFE